jgi:hypothetical protein
MCWFDADSKFHIPYRPSGREKECGIGKIRYPFLPSGMKCNFFSSQRDEMSSFHPAGKKKNYFIPLGRKMTHFRDGGDYEKRVFHPPRIKITIHDVVSPCGVDLINN